MGYLNCCIHRTQQQRQNQVVGSEGGRWGGGGGESGGGAGAKSGPFLKPFMKEVTKVTEIESEVGFCTKSGVILNDLGHGGSRV